MDIKAFEYLLEGYKAYNASLDNNYGNVVVDLPPISPEFPLTIVTEARNVALSTYSTCYERVASVGYRVDIWAQDKGNVSRLTIARTIAEQADEFFTTIGLMRVSFNANSLSDEGGSYHIILTYSGNLDETRRRFI